MRASSPNSFAIVLKKYRDFTLHWLRQFSDLKKPVARLNLAYVLSLGFGFLTNVAWGHYVSTEHFTAIQIVIRYAGMLGILFSFSGLSESISLSIGQRDLGLVFRSIGIRFFGYFAGVGILYAALVSFQSAGLSSLTPETLKMTLLYSPALIIPTCLLSVFLASGQYGLITAVRVASPLITLLTIIFVFMTQPDEKFVAIYFLILGGAHLLILLLILKTRLPDTVMPQRKGLLRYGLQLSAIRLPELITGIDTFILSTCLSPTALASYFLADRLLDVFKGFFLSGISDAYGRYCRIGDRKKILEATLHDFWKYVHRLPVLSLGISALVLVMGLVLWRREYWVAIPVCIGLCLVMIASIPSSFMRQAMIANQEKRNQLFLSASYSVLYVVLLVLLVPKWNLIGVVVAKGLAYAYAAIIPILYVRRAMRPL